MTWRPTRTCSSRHVDVEVEKQNHQKGLVACLSLAARLRGPGERPRRGGGVGLLRGEALRL